MAGRRKKAKIKKFLINLLKWVSAIAPVLAFIYILYYYKQFDFLKKKPEVISKTEVVGESDSLNVSSQRAREDLVRNIRIVKNEWHSVGGIAIHTITVENANAKPVTSAEIEFKYLSDTQAVVTSKIITIKNTLPARKSTVVSGLSVGYVNNSVVGCDTRVVTANF